MLGTQSINRLTANSYPQAGVAFIADNTGRNITQNVATSIQTSGTYSISPSAQFEYRNFTTALTGTLNLLIATSSQYPYVNDQLFITVVGGSATQSVILGNQMTCATSKTISVGTNQYLRIAGIFNGTTYVCDTTVGI